VSLNDVIASFAEDDPNSPYTVTRRGPGTDDGHGNWTDGTVVTTFPSIMSIQPLQGTDLKVLPESYWSDDTRSVYTADTLQLRDRILYQGTLWEVFRLQTWVGFGESHVIAYIANQKVGGNPV
jgi:hypothetical protein